MFIVSGTTGRRLSELPGADEGTEDGVADDDDEEHGGHEHDSYTYDYEGDDEHGEQQQQQAVVDDEDDYADEEESSRTSSSSDSSRWQPHGSSVLSAVTQPEGRLEVRRVWTAEQLRPHLPAVLAATVHEMVQYATLPAQHHEVRMVSG